MISIILVTKTQYAVFSGHPVSFLKTEGWITCHLMEACQEVGENLLLSVVSEWEGGSASRL